MTRVLIFLSLLVSLLVIYPIKSVAQTLNLWSITSIDTMKYSRDAAADPNVYEKIPQQVNQVANSGANYIAIDTPYDHRFLPVLRAWVMEARKNHLKVWFRGNFSGWEGWFNTPKFSDYKIDHQLVYQFITSNPDLFEKGDIFTPVPEPENGAIGDPRKSGKVKEFNQFLVDSYNNCQKAFKIINRQVNCGYFSTNADIAKQILTPQTVKQIGNVVVIDDYVKTPQDLISDINFLYKKFQVPIVVGEYGVPIPGINPDMTEEQQANYLSELFNKFYQEKSLIGGLNYWVLNGGSTSLLNDDNSIRQTYLVVKQYYSPIQIQGQITDQFGQGLANVKVQTQDKISSALSNQNGSYALLIPAKSNQLDFTRSDLITEQQSINSPVKNNYQINLTMKLANPSIWDKFRLWLHNLLGKQIPK